MLFDDALRLLVRANEYCGDTCVIPISCQARYYPVRKDQDFAIRRPRIRTRPYALFRRRETFRGPAVDALREQSLIALAVGREHNALVVQPKWCLVMTFKGQLFYRASVIEIIYPDVAVFAVIAIDRQPRPMWRNSRLRI